MNKHLRFFIIQLLVAAILSLGIARAGADACPPDCDHHAGTVSAVPSCCDDMGSNPVSGDMPANHGDEHDSSGCADGFYCRSESEGNEAVAVLTVPGLEPVVLLPAAASLRPPVHPDSHPGIPESSSPPGNTAAIYILNCSYLI